MVMRVFKNTNAAFYSPTWNSKNALEMCEKASFYPGLKYLYHDYNAGVEGGPLLFALLLLLLHRYILRNEIKKAVYLAVKSDDAVYLNEIADKISDLSVWKHILEEWHMITNGDGDSNGITRRGQTKRPPLFC
jgi:hypothetical protein